MKNKSFDCVKMTRDIRDKLYAQNKGKSLAAFADTLVKEAHKSSLWKKIKIDKTISAISKSA
ncbi:MAG: hypothetical protein FJ264_07005 [Planctomycetes bacterium]|nr:hypothetical protein [Planctomycetota bacterium]